MNLIQLQSWKMQKELLVALSNITVKLTESEFIRIQIIIKKIYSYENNEFDHVFY